MFDSNFASLRARRLDLRKKSPLSVEVQTILKYLSVTLISMILFASFVFLLNTSKTAQQGYVLRQNEILNRELQEQNQLLKEEVLNAQSFQNLIRHDIIRKMQKLETPLFVAPRRDQLTQRR